MGAVHNTGVEAVQEDLHQVIAVGHQAVQVLVVEADSPVAVVLVVEDFLVEADSK
ncbi:MAG: hypothetical protein AABY22_32335 [Nanoarchaeota archaeon]